MTLEDKPIEQTEAEVIKASKFRYMRDLEMYRKLQSLKFTTSEAAQSEIMDIEVNKTSDALLLEFGFDLTHLIKCSRHFKLNENKELISFQKLVATQRESEKKAEIAKAAPSKEVIAALVEEGK